jgi:hypothetical protein
MIFCFADFDSISLLASIAALITAIATIYMVSEIKKQRLNAYTPHLFIEKAQFYVQSMRLENRYMASVWHSSNKDASEPLEYNEKNALINNRFFIKCYNIGFGTAKNVEVKFSYDIEDFINRIKEFEEKVNDKDLKIEIINKENLLTILPNSAKIPYKGFGASPENCMKSEPGYILPVSINQSFASIQIPFIYLELLNVYIYTMSLSNSMMMGIGRVPILNLRINFMDISNKSYEVNFLISINIFMMGEIAYMGEFGSIENKKE